MCVALAVGLATSTSATERCLAQSGPLPTSVVNPRLGAPPPGGHLDETLPRPGAFVPNAGAGSAPPRTGGATNDAVGTPPAAVVPNAATGAVPPPARAVPDAVTQSGPAVPPPAAGAVPPAGR